MNMEIVNSTAILMHHQFFFHRRLGWTVNTLFSNKRWRCIKIDASGFLLKEEEPSGLFPPWCSFKLFSAKMHCQFFFRKEAPSGFFLIPTCCLLHVGASQKRLIILALNHYGNDTVLLFPQLPFLLCLLFFDALSHHIHVFLFVSVTSAAEMASHDETATPDQPARWSFSFELPSQLSTPIFPTHAKINYILGSTGLFRPWEWQIKRICPPKGPVACWEPLALITYYRTPSKSNSNQNSPPKQYHPP